MHEHDGEPEGRPHETQSLARGAKSGDVERFAELYERIAPALFAWASLRIRPDMRAFVDPQDVVQEVWCRAWKAFPNFDADGIAFRPWVFRIAKNVLLEGFRKMQRISIAGANAGPSTRLFQLANLPDSASNISRKLARHEGVEAVLQWVSTLDDDEKKLFLHCGLEGLTYPEVAERLGSNRDVVAKRWQNLRARIAQFGVPRDFVGAE